MLASKQTPLLAVLLLSIFSLHLESIHAMKEIKRKMNYGATNNQGHITLTIDNQNSEISDHSLAQNVLNLFTDFSQFTDLSEQQKTDLMDTFLDIVQAIRYGSSSRFFD